MAVDAFAGRYGWDWDTIQRQPVWLIDILPVVWKVKGELGLPDA